MGGTPLFLDYQIIFRDARHERCENYKNKMQLGNILSMKVSSAHLNFRQDEALYKHHSTSQRRNHSSLIQNLRLIRIGSLVNRLYTRSTFFTKRFAAGEPANFSAGPGPTLYAARARKVELECLAYRRKQVRRYAAPPIIF